MLKTSLFGFCLLLPSLVSATSHWLDPRVDSNYNVSKRVEVFKEATREIAFRKNAKNTGSFQARRDKVSAQQERNALFYRNANFARSFSNQDRGNLSRHEWLLRDKLKKKQERWCGSSGTSNSPACAKLRKK